MNDEVFDLISQEEQRQRETVTLIPSENYASKQVLSAQGSVLNNKYSEGYPGRRYYQGNKIIDQIENLAIERAKELFGVEYVNVQPYSGSPANAAVVMALVDPGETIMGLTLSGGGHLTHGHPKVTFSGKYYNSVQFNVTREGYIDYEQMEKLAIQHRPKLIIVGTTAYPRTLDWQRCAQIAKSCGALLHADISHIAGLVVAGEHPSPVGLADTIMTTTHKTLRGPRGAMIMTNDATLARKIDSAVFPGMQGGPHDNTVAAIAIALGEAQTKEYKEYGKQVVLNAKQLARVLLDEGFELTTGGTDNHLMVVDLRSRNIGGKEAAEMLEEAGIVTNYNSVPFDQNPPSNPGGIRLGTPAVTTRGMKEEEMIKIGKMISLVFKKELDTKVVASQVREMCDKFPI